MSVNGITSANSSYTTPQTTAKTKASQATNTADAKDIGVVYETSSKTDDKSNKIKDYSSVVATMKKELSTKNEQLQNLVTKLLGKQAGKYTKLADLFKDIQADPATIEQAQKDIADDGYWGVEQTSDRLVSMAQALSGGDTSKADTLIAAIKRDLMKQPKHGVINSLTFVRRQLMLPLKNGSMARWHNFRNRCIKTRYL